MYQELINKQKQFFKTKITYDYNFRKEMLKSLYHMIKSNEVKICDALYQDLGKANMEAYMCEVGLVLSSITYAIKHLKSWMKPKKVKGNLSNFPSKSYVLNDPYGVCLIMSPWNYPVLLSLDPLIGAISGGNTAILKLSNHSPATSKLLCELINSTFNEKYIKVLLLNTDETNELLSEQFDFIFFTGSKRVGTIVMSYAAKSLTPVCLELGGKSPCIVTKNANLEIATKRIAFGKIINAGQTCVAPDYIYIDKEIKDKFVEKLKQQIIDFVTSNPLDNPNYPKIISKHHLERLVSLIDKNKVVFGGKYNDEKIEPTILDNVTFDDAVMQEEIFGPLIPIITYNDLNEVYNTLFEKDYPLALYIFTNKKSEYREITKYLRFGGGAINDTLMHLASETIPFGGVGKSGMGNYHGKYTFKTFTHEKGVLKKSTKIDISLRYHPYTKKKEKTIKKILK